MGKRSASAVALVFAALLTACGGGGGAAGESSITVYSGRSEDLVGPLIEDFEDATGIAVAIRYGDTAELASTILEEGDNTPADVFFGQDAGALGFLEQNGSFTALPASLLERVPERYRSAGGMWVGTSGRVRVIVYNPDLLSESEVPDSVFGLTDARWKGRVGWAPTNGSFQIFVTALRAIEGEERARDWLEAMKQNRTQVYESNTPIVEAVAAGEIPLGLVNHYYAFELRTERPDLRARDRFLAGGDPGGLVNVAGVGILEQSDDRSAAERFVEFLLSDQAQTFFVERTFEYPLVPDVEPHAELPPIEELEPPDIDLSQLADLEGTLDLLQDVGLL